MIRHSRIAPFILLNERLGQSDLTGSPMCINGMKVLRSASDGGGIPLTKSGAFYRKFVTWAAEDFRWPGHEVEKLYVVNKVLNEPDFFPLAVMHELMTGVRLLRHYKGKAVITKAGKAVLGDYGALQAELFEAFLLALDRGADDRLPTGYDEPDIAHCLGIVHNRLAGWVSMGELASWCLPLDLIASSRFSPAHDASYYMLFRLVRPLLWLGMVEEQEVAAKGRVPVEDRRYRKTPLFDRLVSFKPFRSGAASQ
jgi:hypothetical protein